MSAQTEATMKFQAGSTSMPLLPGEAAQIDGLPGVFRIVSNNGNLYTLQSEFGTEVKAGRAVVKRAEPGAGGDYAPA